MSAVEAAMAIAVTEAKAVIDPDAPLKERLRKAMEKTRDHWMLEGESNQFNAALAAVTMTATDEEKERIRKEARVLNALTLAASGGVSLNIGDLLDDFDEDEEPIGLLELWRGERK